uniref:dynamin-related protein 4C-like n=1 Tax=Erigeron canadensis TaxID=72917 RepID=UPI001CB8EA92|nr:dynamin-related protein 4C-like [Erigeron canadensis]
MVVINCNGTPKTNGDDYDQKPAIVSCYNEKIRPVLDAVDKLRRLNVTQEGIPLPTIVVVGDQSSGKSSVLESLAGISLPRGQDICTRVPLIMRLQHHPDPVPEFVLEYQNESVKITEEGKIAEAIDKATLEIAGDRKGISSVAVTLVVKKMGVPDLTMVDLPGITRVPIGDQPQDIYEQISGIIMEYIKPEESIILNVLSAAVDFTTCESICMSRRVDSTGQRTLAVVTKCDRFPDGLLEKVMANDVNIGLGYTCVRNRINDETYEEARIQETTLFQTHPLLSNMEKSYVGIPVLAERLVQIQSEIISKCLPDIIKKINEKLNDSVLEFNKLPKKFTGNADALATFMEITGSLQETLKKILIRSEFDQYLGDKQLHGNARLVQMLDEFSKELQTSTDSSERFLDEEMSVLEEANSIRLPNFLPHSVFLHLLQRKVNNISDMPKNLVNKVCDYLVTVCIKVLNDHCGNYPQLLPSMKKATKNVMAKMKAKFMERVEEMIEMEMITDYTCDPDFTTSYNKLMVNRDHLMKAISDPCHYPITSYDPSYQLNLEGYGMINFSHLMKVPENTRDQAFDLKMRMAAYWKIVLKRMVDSVALQLQFQVQKVVNKELGLEIANEVVVRGGIEKMLDEPVSIAKKREKLQRSIDLLRESKRVIEQVMDGIIIAAD